MTELQRCQKGTCPNPVTKKVYWPGQTAEMCEEHAKVALRIATAIGFTVEIEDLPDGNKSDDNRP